MNENLKKRLIGAIVLISLAVIFLPMLLDENAGDDLVITGSNIPAHPSAVRGERSVLPTDADFQMEPVRSFARPENDDSLQSSPQKSKPKPTVAAKPKAVSKPKTKVKKAPVKAKAKVKSKPKPKAKPKAKPKSSQSKRTKSPTAWAIQVASFSDKNKSQALVKRLTKKKYPAYVAMVRVKGKSMFRVQVRPKLDHKSTQKMSASIDKQFKLKTKVVVYP